jgi:hypothetical protein
MEVEMDENEKGEGNYKASREFYEAQGEFVKDEARVEEAARDAEQALDGPEGEELAAAEAEARSHAKE